MTKNLPSKDVRRFPVRKRPREHLRQTKRGAIRINKGVRGPIQARNRARIVPKKEKKVQKRRILPPRIRPKDIQVLSEEELERRFEEYDKKIPPTIMYFTNRGMRGIAAMPRCAICEEPLDLIIMSQRIDKPFPGDPVTIKACKKCFKKYLGKGILVISVDKDKNPDGRRLVVADEEMFKAIDINRSLLAKTRTLFMQDKAFDHAFADVINKEEDKSIEERRIEIKELAKQSAKLDKELKKMLEDLGL
jgi:hypothetical protein